MRLSVATLLGFAAAAVNAVVFITNNGNKAAAVFTDAFKNTYVIYQRDDNGVGLLRGSIPNAQSAAAYTASGLLNAGIARSNTPLAIAIDYSPGNSAAHYFYHSTITCNGGYLLKHKYQDPITQNWVDGDLNKLNVCATGNLLYAIGPFECGGQGSNNPMRVGYVEAGTSQLKEARQVYTNGVLWATAQVA